MAHGLWLGLLKNEEGDTVNFAVTVGKDNEPRDRLRGALSKNAVGGLTLTTTRLAEIPEVQALAFRWYVNRNGYQRSAEAQA